MHNVERLLPILIAGIFVSLSAFSQDAAPAEHPAHTSNSTADESLPTTSGRPVGTDPDPIAVRAAADFIMKASIDGMTEVQLAQLALSRSTNARVRNLAQHLVSDSTVQNDKLAEVALMKNVSVPRQIDAAHEAVFQQLKAKQGQAFDAAYVSQTIAAHDRAISLYMAASGQLDSEIAAYAYRTLPTLKSHKQMAEAIKGS